MSTCQMRVVGLLVALNIALVSCAERPPVPRVERAAARTLEVQGERFEAAEASNAEDVEALEASYRSKKADLEAESTRLRSEITTRAEELRVCDAAHQTLVDSDDKLTRALDVSSSKSKIRDARSKFYDETDKAEARVVKKAQDTLDVIRKTLEAKLQDDGELAQTLTDGRGVQSPPSSQLNDLMDMARNLEDVFQKQVQVGAADTQALVDVMDCPACEATNKDMVALGSKVKADMDAAAAKCTIIRTQNRELDDAARDRDMQIQKELEQLEKQQRIAREVRAQVEKQRKAAKALLGALKKDS